MYHIQSKAAMRVILAITAALSGCITPPTEKTATSSSQPPVTAGTVVTDEQPVKEATNQPVNNLQQRKDMAAHLYKTNSKRIFKGRLPPLLYAVGVLKVDLDSRGEVTHLQWMRAPSHAPEVISEIEATVRKSAPFPVPPKTSTVSYIDTWLWHKSGRFQLHTLSEGQI